MTDEFRLNCLTAVETPVGGLFDVLVKGRSSIADLVQRIAEDSYPDTQPANLFLSRPKYELRIPDAPSLRFLCNVRAVDMDFVPRAYTNGTMDSLDPSRLIKDEFHLPLDPDHIHVLVHEASTPSTLHTLYHRFWGKPLDRTWTELRLRGNDIDQIIDVADENPNAQDDVLLATPIMEIDPTFRFLVRAEYLRVFDEVRRIYNKASEHERDVIIADVTGQVGIGKSCWVYYAIARCLSESQQVIWCQGSTFWLLSSFGVRSIDLRTIKAHTYGRKSTEPIWCFIDMNRASIPLLTRVYGINTHIFPILVNAQDKGQAGKGTGKYVYPIFMNPWTLAELEAVRSLFYPDRSRSELCERYKTAGGSPRICLKYDRDRYEDFLLRQQEAISDLAQPEVLSNFIQGATLRDFDPATSYLVCSIRRYPHYDDEPEKEKMLWCGVDPLTPSVGRQIQTLIEKNYESGAFKEAGISRVCTSLLHGTFVDLIPRALHYKVY